MISVSSAKKLIFENAPPGNIKIFPLNLACGLTLAEDLYAQYDIPAFAQSSMDGYAFAFRDLKSFGKLKVLGEMAAGAKQKSTIEPGEAVRIFTGAPLPEGADTVVMQEKIKLESGYLFIEDNQLLAGMHMRAPGSEIAAGTIAMQKNELLTAPAIGFLAGTGIAQAKIFAPPSVYIIITGDELQQPGGPLSFGQVFESNSYSLTAALRHWGIESITTVRVKDKLEDLVEVFREIPDETDLVLLTGGISVGDYDFVAAASASTGVKQIFHRVKQKPGKPLFFGRREQTLIFGLPGNPASVLTCFYEYVSIVLGAFMKKTMLKSSQAVLSSEIKKPAGLTHFLRGSFNGNSVEILQAQESYRLSSFARANCLVVAEEDRTEYKKNELVEVHLIPG